MKIRLEGDWEGWIKYFLRGRSDSRDYDRLKDDKRPLIPVDDL